MAKERIQVFADEETKRRIELAGLKRDMSVTDYCLQAIRLQLEQDHVLEADLVEIPVVPATTDRLLGELRSLRSQIAGRRKGQLIDPAILEQVRRERDEELTGLP